MTPQALIGDAWYFYAGPVEYVCRLDRDGKIPERFYGPYASRAEALTEYHTWKLTHNENGESTDD